MSKESRGGNMEYDNRGSEKRKSGGKVGEVVE